MLADRPGDLSAADGSESADVGAALGEGVDEAFVAQDFDGFAHGDARDTVGLLEEALAGDGVVAGEFARG
jgi:hypothetical protein